MEQVFAQNSRSGWKMGWTVGDKPVSETLRLSHRAADAPAEFLKRLRSLRRDVRELNTTMVKDVEPFLQKEHKNGVTFRRLPYSDLLDPDPSKDKSRDVGVTVTCTVLMALGVADKLSEFYDDKTNVKPKLALSKVLDAQWKSSGLKEGNKFTTILVLRTASILGLIDETRDAKVVRASVDDIADAKEKDKATAQLAETEGKTLRQIADGLLAGNPETIVVNEYPPSPAIVYWFIDAVGRYSPKLALSPWAKFATWASQAFSRQVSLVTSSHDAMMDPVALAMSACLCARLRGMAPNATTKKEVDDFPEMFPSEVELRSALRLFMKKQQDSGIWEKYFPMFHYPDAGGNYCFSFEMLEAVLSEFGKTDDEAKDLLSDDVMLCGLERAVQWIKSNRLAYQFGGQDYRGWNSGGQLDTLSRGIPESWATGVVHWFLFKLNRVLSAAIRATLLSEYKEPPEKEKRWASLLSSHTKLSGGQKDVKEVLESVLVNWDKDTSGKRKRSALLFGPPGTSKTSYIKHLAAEHGWPCVSINPSHFLRDGLERIFGRANEIFADLMDLSKVVVFFDEMDPLVQKREAGSDIHHQSLTTVFLPKLADLYNHNKVVFFMATNHLQQIDPAIRRPGRFDYLLFVGPPGWRDKFEALTKGSKKDFDALTKKEQEKKQKAHTLLDGWAKDWPEKTFSVLDRFTFDEMRDFFNSIRSITELDDLGEALEKFGTKKFQTEVLDWSTNSIVLRDDSEDQKEFLKDKESSRG